VALRKAQSGSGLSFPLGRGSTEPPSVAAFGQGRRNPAAANYCLQF